MKTRTRKPSAMFTNARPVLPIQPTVPVAAGDRVRWDGDMANDPGNATVTAVDGAFMTLAFDDGRKFHATPIALLGSPRWRKITAQRFCVRMDHDDGMGGRSHSFMVRIDAADKEAAAKAAEIANPGHRAYEVMTEEEWAHSA